MRQRDTRTTLGCLRLRPVRTTLSVLVPSLYLMGPSGTARAATLHVPADYPSIQSAIVAAQPGDEVRVAAGTYTGAGNKNLDFLGKDIIVAGEGAAVTTIDVERQGQAFWIRRGETNAARIEGFTIRNGNTLFSNLRAGGGILCENASPTIQDCIVEDCVGTEHGGGIAMYVNAPATISGCIIRNNRAAAEADGSGDGAGLRLSGPVTLVNCTIEGNEGGPGAFRGGYGGGLICDGGVVLENCLIANNRVWGRDSGGEGLGGAIYGEGLRISGCRIVGNQVEGHGGGLYLVGDAEIRDCVISGNRAEVSGGGIAAVSATPIIVVGCTIASNYADGLGDIGPYPGGGIICRQSGRVELRHSILWGNGSGAGPNEAFVEAGSTLAFICADLDRSGVMGEGALEVSSDCLNSDPGFCAPLAYGNAPTAEGEYTLLDGSTCLPEHNGCGVQIGALGIGCGATAVTVTTWGSIKARFRSAERLLTGTSPAAGSGPSRP